MSTKENSVLTRLPTELHYLIEPVLRCGFFTERDAFDYLDRATPQQMEELAGIAARVLANDDYPVVMAFVDEYPLTENQESAKLYFFFGALDHAGLQFDRGPELTHHETDGGPVPSTGNAAAGAARWRNIHVAEYNEDELLQYYVNQYWSSHMTDFEKRCHHLGAGYEKAKAERFSTPWGQRVLAEWRAADNQMHAALADGLSTFLLRVEPRIRDALSSGSLKVNRCPRCAKISRTPMARQCFWCGHDWHAPSDNRSDN
ncbi:MAG: hypothetical protein L0Y72_19305 [Gemmataceae bacterium]|nr:hypothetical protein [Gemmataceae bacterium]MCI0741183.1 hypothetical protein [Gemmataceae bacterium]